LAAFVCRRVFTNEYKMTDSQRLLADYVTNRSEQAFRELVTRYLDLVYSTAVRLVGGDTHRAKDVAQTVFVDLARKAPTLPRDVMLGGWLHRHTCFVASKIMRGERRRQFRERQAVEMNALQDHSEANFAQAGPILDEAINQLGEQDRAAILLRFFEQRDLRSVGEALGSTENAAQKRVTRALEELRGLLKHRGVTSSAVVLGTVLASEAVTAAPAGLAATVSSAALAGAAAGTAATVTLLRIMTMTNLKLGISALVVAGATTALVVQHQAQTKLREESESLQQQISQLQSENGRLSNLVAQANNSQSLADDQRNELFQLRDEVTRLRADSQELAQWKAANAQQANDPMEAAAKALLGKINLLKERLRQRPEWNIPELQYLSDRNWAFEALNADLDSEEGVREALSELRNKAKGVLAMSISSALDQYTRANNGQLPTDVPQLQPYFAWHNISPVPDLDPAAIDAILQRYQMLKTGNVSDLQSNEMVLAEKAPVDDKYDYICEIGLTSTRSHAVGDTSGIHGSITWPPWQPPDSK
jgi:RNA polymerase sigma factor (sigma-70 family)